MTLKTECPKCSNTVEVNDNAPVGYLFQCKRCGNDMMIENNDEKRTTISYDNLENDEIGVFYNLDIEAGDDLHDCDKCGEMFDLGEKIYIKESTTRSVLKMCEDCAKIKVLDDSLEESIDQ